MRTYDPSDHITYVHLAQDPVASAAASRAHEGCHRLPAGYANVSHRGRLDEPRATCVRPSLVVLPGGSAAAEVPAAAEPTLRLAQ